MSDHHGHAGHAHEGHSHAGHAEGERSPGEHAHGGRGHSHAPASFGRAFAVGIGLNAGFVLVEAGYGYASGSLALVADAGHNLSDVLGLVVAWGASALARRPPSARYTYGLRGSPVLAALFNALVLLLAVGGIAWEAVQRLLHPAPVAGVTVMAVAAAGIVVNGVTAWLFASGRKGDVNIRGAYLHMLADAAVSAGVVLSGLGILLTGWAPLDALTSLVVVAVIVAGTWGLLREGLALSLHAVPRAIDPAAVRALLLGRPGVAEVHDLHVWPIGTTETALTAHLVMPGGAPGDAFLRELAQELRERHGIGHVTLQVEQDGAGCALAPEHVI